MRGIRSAVLAVRCHRRRSELLQERLAVDFQLSARTRQANIAETVHGPGVVDDHVMYGDRTRRRASAFSCNASAPASLLPAVHPLALFACCCVYVLRCTSVR